MNLGKKKAVFIGTSEIMWKRRPKSLRQHVELGESLVNTLGDDDEHITGAIGELQYSGDWVTYDHVISTKLCTKPARLGLLRFGARNVK